MKVFCSPAFNLIFHNCAWLLCVVGRERLIWFSLPLVVCYTILLLQNSMLSTRALVLPFLIGVSVDSLLTWLSVFQFGNSSGFISLWLVVLWLSFATTFSLSLRFLASNWGFAIAAGAIAMPVNYIVGAEIGAVQLGLDVIATVVVLGLIWGTLFPVIFTTLKKMDGNRAGA